MPDQNGAPTAFVNMTVNGRAVRVPQGASVAAALLHSQVPCRLSASGEPRTPLCGMGVCFECRATIDGAPHRRTCQILCCEGMTVETQR